jgi:hypothetical protein
VGGVVGAECVCRRIDLGVVGGTDTDLFHVYVRLLNEEVVVAARAGVYVYSISIGLPAPRGITQRNTKCESTIHLYTTEERHSELSMPGQTQTTNEIALTRTSSQSFDFGCEAIVN